MNDNMLLAWQAVKHWLDIYQLFEKGYRKTLPISWYNCSFCLHYYGQECKGCPVKAHTKQIRCGGTPYYEIVRMIRFNHSDEMLRSAIISQYALLVDIAIKTVK